MSLTLDLREESKLGQSPRSFCILVAKSSDSRSHGVVVWQAEQDADEDDVQQRDDVAELQIRRFVSARIRRNYSSGLGKSPQVTYLGNRIREAPIRGRKQIATAEEAERDGDKVTRQVADGREL